MKHIIPGLAALLLAGAVHADTPRKYGILSLAGDSFSVVTSVAGTRLDANDRQVYGLGDNTVFDEAAIRSASAALEKAEPAAGRFLMLSTDAELHRAQNAMFDDPGVVTCGKTNADSQGVLMPFAYLKLRLINADTLDVENEVRQKQSQMVTYAQDADERAVRTWQALDAKEKISLLDQLVRRAVSDGVPRLLKP